jgi:hypothetical protein
MQTPSFLFLGALAAIAGCALDPTGAAPTDDGAGGAGTPAGSGPGPSSATSTGSGDGVTTTGGSGGSPGAGGAPSSTGAGGDGGQGASSGEGGAGGAGGAGTGQGGAGVGGAGGDGGAGGTCGDGTVDPDEECDGGDPLACDPLACTWLGECGAARPASFTPGGTTITGDTTVAPSTTAFDAQCSDPGDAPTHLYSYVTSAPLAYVEVVAVGDGNAPLADAILSLHVGCADATQLDCRFQTGVDGCCADAGGDGAVEVLLTDGLLPGTTVTAAVTGYLGDAGSYGVRFREYRYLLAESFTNGVGSFTTSDWAHVGPHERCAGGGACMVLAGGGESPNEILTSGAVDASGVGAVFLGWFHQVDNSGVNLLDEQIVEVSADGGATWTEVYRQPNGVDEFGVWKQVDVSMLAGAPDARVRFVYQDGGFGDNGWFVDEVSLVAF